MDISSQYDNEHPIITQAREEWPICFALSKIEQISGGAIRRQTIRNLRCQKEIPEKCFARYNDRKVIVQRDPFLDWWNTKLKSNNDQN